MRYVCGKYGDCEDEFKAMMADNRISTAIRLDALAFIAAMDRREAKLQAECELIDSSRNIYELDWISRSDDPRTLRPWMSFTDRESGLVMLHAKRDYTGGQAERSAARLESIARYRLEFE